MEDFVVLVNTTTEETGHKNHRLRILRRNLRDKQNPFTSISDQRFIDLYRLPKSITKDLIDELQPFLNSTTRRHAVPCHLKVLSSLRFYATGTMQRAVGQNVLSQTSVSRALDEVTNAINRIVHHHVKFPSVQEFEAVKTDFQSMYGFPGVVGLIDGTHVKICTPNSNVEHIYYCQKGGYSKNVLVICDANMVILSGSARFGGTASDAHVWECSQARQFLETTYNNGEKDSWLLGDSSYPLQPWLMTPIANAITEAEERYNYAHKATRSLVERCIALLKSRFLCLSTAKALFYEPKKTTYIIYACMVLHNILVRARVPFTEDEAHIDEEFDDDSPPSTLNIHSEVATEQRAHIVRDHFE